MSNFSVDDISSILKFLDENFLTEIIFSEIQDFSMENTENQRLVVRSILLPGFNEMNRLTQDHLIDSLREIVENDLDCSSVFERITTPFDFSNVDYKDFMRIVYQEIKATLQKSPVP